MKLNGANMLELSLSIAFALVVLTTSLQLIQEATDRVNKGYQFKSFQEKSYNALIRVKEGAQWPWNSNILPFNEMNISLDTNSTITVQPITYTNNQWINSNENGDGIKLTIENSHFSKNLSIYAVHYPSKNNLLFCLATIKIALKKYYDIYQFYPPNQQLNYLIQSNILNFLPNNPYTIDDSITNTNRNITDWSYSNINGTITLFAYTHPDIKLIIQ